MILINSAALIHNYQVIKKRAPSSKILAMLKANAYGHGIIKIAKILSRHDKNIGGFGVACLSEAIKLRKNNIIHKIVVMRGVYNTEELILARHLKLDLLIHNHYQLNLLINNYNNTDPLTLWLKINTGMNRLGFLPEEINNIYQQLNKTNHKDIIFITHLAESENPDQDFTRRQINIFDQTVKSFSASKSIVNSGGIINYPDNYYDWIRPGLMLYGVSPLKDKTGVELGLRPVMNCQSYLLNIRFQKKGDKMGYNGLYSCPEDMLIGIAAIGYGDGYPQYVKPGALVWINHQLVPIIGKVSMDSLIIDLRLAPKSKINDKVIFLG